MDLSMLPASTLFVLFLILVAEGTNGITDAPVGTSAAVASGALTGKQALIITALGNFFGLVIALLVGATVAKTIGTGIVQASMITVPSIGIAILTSIIWALIVWRMGLPVSKTHSLLAALAGIGYAQGGFAALMPADGHWMHSGWVAVGEGLFIAIVCGSALSWFIARLILSFKLDKKIVERDWKKLQIGTVCAVSSGHGFNDGLKYVGIFTLVLYISGVIPKFQVMPWVVMLCALVMATATLIGGWRIHKRLDRMVNHDKAEESEKSFKPFMGVSAEFVSAFFIWQTGFLGMPTSTNHAVISAMAGAKSTNGTTHASSVVRIIWGWVVTYIFCFFAAYFLTRWFL